MRNFQKPKAFEYNVAVIGAGSGGLVAAYIAATVKAKVVLIEKNKMGGDCLNTGCVPSKALLRSAKILSYSKRAKEFGFRSASVDFDFAEVMERVQRVIKTIEPHDSIERYTNLGVDCIQGEAKIRTPYTIEVNGRVITTKNIIIATGAGPLVPQTPGLSDISYLTTDTVWKLRKLPQNLTILGGGPIGCELAQAFQRLGSQVTLIEKAQTILPREDEDAAAVVRECLKSEGVRILESHEGLRFLKQGQNSQLICKGPQGEQMVSFDEVLLALGRKAHVQGFGLEELGIELTSQGTLATDPFLRTVYPNIFACGDVVGPFQFTHVASHQAWYASVNALFSPFKKYKVDYRVIPWCTFTDPEVARVGLNEKEARERGIPFSVTKYAMDDLDRAIADSENRGFVKVLTPPKKDTILGVTTVGPHASDTLTEFVTAMKFGLGLNKILSTIHMYPTLAESNKYAAGVWKKSNAPQGVLSFLERFHRWRRG